MADDRIAFLKALHPFADFFYPAGIFVSHDVRQFHIHFLTPYPLNYVEISAANTSSSNADNYIRASSQFRFFYFLQDHEVRVGKRSVILMKNSGFHNNSRESQDRFEIHHRASSRGRRFLSKWGEQHGGADDYRSSHLIWKHRREPASTFFYVFSILLDTVERVSGHSVRIEFGPDELFAHCCRGGLRGRKCDRIAALAFRAVFDRNVASNAQDKFVSFFVVKRGDSMCFLSRSPGRL